jgi:hypothetical protein
MAAHSSLTGADLHEVKGADTATVGQILIADGAGAATFQEPTAVAFIGLAATDSTTQTKPAAATKKAITLNTNLVINDVSHTVSSASITLNTSGVYTLICIPQLVSGGGGAGLVEISWEVDTGGGFGTVAGTPIQINIPANGFRTPVCQVMYDATAGDIVRSVWSTDSAAIDIKAPTSLVGDTIPSVQVYVIREGT